VWLGCHIGGFQGVQQARGSVVVSALFSSAS